MLTVFESWNGCSCPAGLAYPLNPKAKFMTIRTSRFWDAQNNQDKRKVFFVSLLLKEVLPQLVLPSFCVALYIDLSCFGISAQGLKRNERRSVAPWQV